MWVATGWSSPCENVSAMTTTLCRRRRGSRSCPALSRRFRDPFHFRDPADGSDYLLFTASLKASASEYNGVIGIARAEGDGLDGWRIVAAADYPPMVSTMKWNARSCAVHDGRYYAFWSTQRRTFAPGGPTGPNGLYGMVADSLFGHYRPLNGSGLVAANPLEEPLQTYSWWVTDDLEVAGFVDHWGLEGRSLDDHPDLVDQPVWRHARAAFSHCA